jgi:hypothetical protein
MTRCNGSCSGGRAIPVLRTPAGKPDPFAERGKCCFAAYASIATSLMKASRGAFTSIAEWTPRPLQQVRALPEWHIDWEPSPAIKLGHEAPLSTPAVDEVVQ